MGILNSLMDGMAKKLAEQAWPAYQQACIKDARTLCSYIDNEENFFRKTVFLLALSKKDEYKSKEYYNKSKQAYNNQLNNLKKYNRFEHEVDTFMNKMSSRY